MEEWKGGRMDLEMQSLAAVDVRQTLCRRRGREGRFDLVATSEHQICSKQENIAPSNSAAPRDCAPSRSRSKL